MEFNHFEQDNVWVVSVYGSFTGRASFELNQSLQPLMKKIKENRQAGLIIDMKQVDSIDSAGIGLICGKFVQLKKQGKRFALSHVSRLIQETFNHCGLNKTIPFYSTTPEALHYLGTPDASTSFDSPSTASDQKASEKPSAPKDFMRPQRKRLGAY